MLENGNNTPFLQIKQTGYVSRVKVNMRNSIHSLFLEYGTVRYFDRYNTLIPPNETRIIYEDGPFSSWVSDSGERLGISLSELKGRTYLIEIQLVDAFDNIIAYGLFLHKF